MKTPRKSRRNQTELYDAMRDAIRYMRSHPHTECDSSVIARHVGMSVPRFEHAFKAWVGIAPKRFLSYLTKERAKSLLRSSVSVMHASFGAGLSGPGRLHGILTAHDAISPGEYKSGEFSITYGMHATHFGWSVIGITSRGICALAFLRNESEAEARASIRALWPKAALHRDQRSTEPFAVKVFGQKKSTARIPFLASGTNFQIKVWEALLAIPEGAVASYADIAKAIGRPKAVRAVGSACGKNPIAFLIPCHRVLTSEGGLGGYRWGAERKDAILAWEQLQKK